MDNDLIDNDSKLKKSWGLRYYDSTGTTEKDINSSYNEDPTWIEVLREFLNLMKGHGYIISDDKVDNIIDAAEEVDEKK